MTTPQPDPVQTACDLTAALNGVSARLAEVKTASEDRDTALGKQDERIEKHGRRSRWLIWVDVALTVALAVTGFFLAHANSRADTASASAAAAEARASAVTTAQQSLHTALIEGCESTNARYAQQLVFWDFLFGTAKGKPSAELVRFEALVKEAFAPRDCQKVYAITPSKGSGTGG